MPGKQNWDEFNRVSRTFDTNKSLYIYKNDGKQLKKELSALSLYSSSSFRNTSLGSIISVQPKSRISTRYSIRQFTASMAFDQKKEFHDSRDVSIDPSFDIMQFRYDLNCAVRYRQAKEEYERVFQQEINQILQSKPTVLEQFIMKRIFSYTTFWPPLHTKREINYFKNKFFQLTPKQKKRLDYLMSTELC